MRTRTQHAPFSIWIARLVWVSLPLTAGIAAAGALDGWSTAPGTLAATYLWVAWAVGLVALLAPRPLGLTALRAVAPAFFGLAVVAAATGSASGPATITSVMVVAVATACALSPAVAVASASGAAYGDERRFPLKVPPVLFLGPLPVAPLLIAAGAAAGPLLLSDGRIAVGLVALLGVPVAALAARSLHTLAQRFVVLVPAGVAIVDPFTLSDPVLLLRERITSLRRIEPSRRPPEDTLDVRIGATGGSIAITLDTTTDALQVRRGRRGSETVRTNELWCAVVGSREFVEIAGERKIRAR